MMKIIWQMLIGAVVGFFGAYGLLAADFEGSMNRFGFQITLALGAITLVLVISSFIYMQQIRKKASVLYTEEEEDFHDEWQYKKYSDISLANNTALILSICALGMAVVTTKSIVLIVSGILLVVAVSIFASLQPTLLKAMYPDRELPNASEKNYSKKLLAVSDEGERHVMLEGLYSAFSLTNILLVVAMTLLIIYSVGTGHSQLFALLVIGLVLITVNVRYFLKVRDR